VFSVTAITPPLLLPVSLGYRHHTREMNRFTCSWVAIGWSAMRCRSVAKPLAAGASRSYSCVTEPDGRRRATSSQLRVLTPPTGAPHDELKRFKAQTEVCKSVDAANWASTPVLGMAAQVTR
jgi:hypothetical protein